MTSEQRTPRRRPEWWPQGEAWPPGPQHWPRMRGRFVRRMGCVFLLFNLLVSSIFVGVLGWLAGKLGFLQVPASFFWGTPLMLLLFLLALGAMVMTGRSLRRLSAPIGDLLDASGRVAEGDFSARVSEQGPREVRSLIKAFNSMADRLQTNEEQRRDLLADVTHELRTPLTVIQGNIEAMLDGVYPADETQLRSILEEAQLLNRLVEDLRILSLAESGALYLRKESTDLGVLLNETAGAFRLQAEERRVQLSVEIAGDPPLIDLDPERIRQVLSNLIANALRYTPPGGTIRLRMGLDPQSDASWLALAVSDSGPGIQPADLPHIFDRFYKTGDSSGMGLGLAIARYLVTAHGGEILAESAPGQGTTLHIRLPLESQTSS